MTCLMLSGMPDSTSVKSPRSRHWSLLLDDRLLVNQVFREVDHEQRIALLR